MYLGQMITSGKLKGKKNKCDLTNGWTGNGVNWRMQSQQSYSASFSVRWILLGSLKVACICLPMKNNSCQLEQNKRSSNSTKTLAPVRVSTILKYLAIVRLGLWYRTVHTGTPPIVAVLNVCYAWFAQGWSNGKINGKFELLTGFEALQVIQFGPPQPSRSRFPCTKRSKTDSPGKEMDSALFWSTWDPSNGFIRLRITFPVEWECRVSQPFLDSNANIS